MNGLSVYEKILMTDGLTKMKNLRDGMNGTVRGFDDNIIYDYSSVSDVNDNSYLFVMELVEDVNIENIENTITGLLDVYEIKYRKLSIPWETVRVSSKTKEPIFYEPKDEKKVLLIICNDTLFIFKKYGLSHYLNSEVLNAIKEKNGIQKHKYISLIEGNAFSDILNHNNDSNDESRGTNCYSLEYFFNSLFGADEYSLFKQYFNKYSIAIKEYFGIAVVKTLHSNTLFSYKDDIKKSLRMFDCRKNEVQFSGYHISDSQFEALQHQFIDDRYYELIIGKSEFARCFITSEWLYNSFDKIAGSIDLTAISMGYYKALEQFMYEMISMYTVEKGFIDRKITLPGRKLEPLTDALINSEKKLFTLGSMVIFLTSKFNADILRDDINEETKHFIYDVLNGIKDQRNGFFHKDNILDWVKIEKDRLLAFTAFFVLLSGFKFSPNCNLIPSNDTRDEYQKICEHFDKVARNFEMLAPPIIYFNDNNIYDFYMLDSDPYRTYNEDGTIIYSGIYFHRLSDNNPVKIKIQNDQIERLTIYQGRLIISKETPISLKPTGPEQLVVSAGKFVLKEE